MAFEMYTRTWKPGSDPSLKMTVVVRLGKNPALQFQPEFMKQYGKGRTHVQLLWDKDSFTVGIRFCQKGALGSISICTSAKGRQKAVCIKGFMRHFEIPFISGNRYELHRDDKNLLWVFELLSPTAEAKAEAKQ